MGDEGSALGAAIKSASERGLNCDWISEISMPYFGPKYSEEETELALQKGGLELDYNFVGKAWPKIAGKLVANNNIIGVFQEEWSLAQEHLETEAL